VAIESDGFSKGNPRMYELIQRSPEAGSSPTLFAFSEFMDFLRVMGQPVQGPWPPNQNPRPDPMADSMPTAVSEPARSE
jgi:hypothetical protein